jgi:hypothetical protein
MCASLRHAGAGMLRTYMSHGATRQKGSFAAEDAREFAGGEGQAGSAP